MLKLVRATGEGAGQTIEIASEPLLLGRQPHGNGVVVLDSTVSREHARVFLRAGEFHVADLNSSNGTYVNGQRVTRATLSAGDVLRLGSVEFTVAESAAAPAGARGNVGSTAGAEIALEDPAALEQTLFIGPPHPIPAPTASPAADVPPAPSRIAPRALARSAPAGPAAARGGLLRADLGQYGFLPRLLLILLALAIAAGLFVGALRLATRVVPEGGFQRDAAPADVEPESGE